MIFKAAPAVISAEYMPSEVYINDGVEKAFYRVYVRRMDRVPFLLMADNLMLRFVFEDLNLELDDLKATIMVAKDENGEYYDDIRGKKYLYKGAGVNNAYYFMPAPR